MAGVRQCRNASKNMVNQDKVPSAAVVKFPQYPVFFRVLNLGRTSNTTLRILSVKGGGGVPPKSVTPFLPKILSVKGGRGVPPYP